MEKHPASASTPAPKTRSRRLRLCLQIIFYLFLAAGLLLVPQVIVYYPMYWLLGAELSRPFWAAIFSIISYGLALALLFLLLKYRPDFRKLPKWSDLALAPIGLVFYTFSATILTGLFSKFPFFDAEEAQNLIFSTPYFTGDKIITFIAVAIIAPIAEELIFRGWLYGKLRARISGKASLPLSIFLTSALFGLLHGQWNVAVNVFCLSAVLCALREITGRLHAGILLHILKNSIAFFLLFVV